MEFGSAVIYQLCGINVEYIGNSKAAALNCKVEHLPFLYLGLPLGGYAKQLVFGWPVIDNFQKKLDRWKRFN